MKKIMLIAGIVFYISACNSSSKGIPSTDSLHNDNIDQSDMNNRNLTTYDSSKEHTGNDTIPNEKNSDSTRH
jgi:hypothetical protein